MAGLDFSSRASAAPLDFSARATSAAPPSVAEDAWSGFTQPFVKLGHDVAQNYRDVTARATAPLPSPMAAIRQAGSDLMAAPRMVGDALGVTAAPVQAVVRPVARAININGPAPYEAPQVSMTGGPHLTAPRPLYGDEAQAKIESGINTALAGARPAAPRAPVASPPPTMDELQAAKTAAYQNVDNLGVRYTPQAFSDLADTITADLGKANFNPKLHPATAAMLDHINGLANQAAGHSPTLTDLDQLRQVVGRDVASSPSAGEQMMGQKIKAAIDNFVNTAGPKDVVTGAAGDAQAAADAISQARDLNTRFSKVQDLTAAVESAKLRAASTGSGGNADNAIRQNLRRLLESGRSFTDDERTALEAAIRGGPIQNVLRLIGKLSPTGSGLMGTAELLTAIPTHGVSVGAGATGLAAKTAADMMTNQKVSDLAGLMSQGGVRPPPAPAFVSPTIAATPRISMTSPAGVVGAGEVAAPWARLPGRKDQTRDAPPMPRMAR